MWKVPAVRRESARRENISTWMSSVDMTEKIPAITPEACRASE
jgi:hypothetical protein